MREDESGGERAQSKSKASRHARVGNIILRVKLLTQENSFRI